MGERTTNTARRKSNLASLLLSPPAIKISHCTSGRPYILIKREEMYKGEEMEGDHKRQRFLLLFKRVQERRR